jgi:hypothetical protein
MKETLKNEQNILEKTWSPSNMPSISEIEEAIDAVVTNKTQW